ncbi:MAG: NDP-sugar synthase [Nocardioidaceae bacterium]|nr:NDP-sugar synthase [Nocardioidaceae bacterium]
MPGMEAVIVAGGLGSRLRPLTARRPKHVLPVAGEPLLAHQLARLADAGVEHVVLATSYRADELRWELGDGERFGLRLSYAYEQTALGTGGAVRNALAELRGGAGDPVLVLNGDQLSDHDLRAQVSHFAAAGADVSLHVVIVGDPRPYGCVPTDAGGRVTAFREKSADPVSPQVNAGSYVFRRSVLGDIPAGVEVSLERETFPRLLRAGRALVGYRDDGYWLDVGTPDALVRASSDLVRGLVRSPALPDPPGERLVHPSARVHPGARVLGGSALGPDVVVGDRSVVDGSVLMAGAVLGTGTTVVASAIGPAAQVGDDSLVRASVLGDAAVLGARCELVDGGRVGCDVRIPDDGLRFTAG